MSTLRTVVYVSTATVPTTGPVLERLLIEARAFNAKSGVTGMLLCSEINFMQCFEGTQEAVAFTRERITRSRSHTGIIELLNTQIEKRSFDGFQMGLGRATDSQLLRMSTARWQLMTESNASTDSMGLDLLKQFWRNSR